MSVPLPFTDIPEEIEEDWEEWDGRSPFWIHCVAGSLAGVSEVSAHGRVFTKKRIVEYQNISHVHLI